ncbi:DUF438 domain-containing protein [Chloroflexota bacterium]
MTEITHKKETIKDIILNLHKGLSVEDAKKRFDDEVGDITSSEIADIEQSLIEDGLSPGEITKFCNVHALLFESALEQATAVETSQSHPVYLFKLENREIEKRLEVLKDTASKNVGDVDAYKDAVGKLLSDLKGVILHYERKEQLLFPYLEKKGFMGPSQVMWGKHNEIRGMFNTAAENIGNLVTPEEVSLYSEKELNPLAEEIGGMIFKEESILFPASLEKLGNDDWVEILKESGDIGYVYIEQPEETEELLRHLKASIVETPHIEDGEIALPTGTMLPTELMLGLNALPVDLTFVDKNDKVRYFSDSKERIFTRTKSIIGRDVRNCHPPQSVDVVEKILATFKEGTRDSYDFWINLGGRLVYIRYFAVRDKNGTYTGTLEVTQDITDIKNLDGEKRLIEERD